MPSNTQRSQDAAIPTPHIRLAPSSCAGNRWPDAQFPVDIRKFSAAPRIPEAKVQVMLLQDTYTEDTLHCEALIKTWSSSCKAGHFELKMCDDRYIDSTDVRAQTGARLIKDWVTKVHSNTIMVDLSDMNGPGELGRWYKTAEGSWEQPVNEGVLTGGSRRMSEYTLKDLEAIFDSLKQTAGVSA